MAALPLPDGGAARDLDMETLQRLDTANIEPLEHRFHQILEKVGIYSVPAGVILILLAWRGASQSPFLFQQVPYLISGGLLGLGLLIMGSVVYLATWIARTAQMQRHQNQAVIDTLVIVSGQLGALHEAQSGQAEELAEALRTRSSSGGRAPAGRTRASGRSKGEVVDAAPFRVTPSGSMYHRPDCAVVSSRDDLKPVAGTEAGLRPCGMCEPTSSAA